MARKRKAIIFFSLHIYFFVTLLWNPIYCIHTGLGTKWFPSPSPRVAWDRAFSAVREHLGDKGGLGPPVQGVFWHFLSKIIHKIQTNRQKSERSFILHIGKDDCNTHASSSTGYYVRWIRKTVYNPKRTRQAKKVDRPWCTEGKITCIELTGFLSSLSSWFLAFFLSSLIF